MNLLISPIKTQGKKTKILPSILEEIKKVPFDTYYEPFLGSGEVFFNVNPDKAVVADNNKLLIHFFLDLQNHVFDHNTARTFLEKHGQLLQEKGQEYYYEMRSEFNKNADSLYFLFINRSCFNGMIRFNSKGEFNVPFCRKPNRFSKSYITKIVNQIERIEKLIWEHGNNWVFLCQSWQQTLADVNGAHPIVYLDPPYVDRHATYFDDWTDEKNDELFHFLSNCPYSFVLSNWKKNQWRTNDSLNIFNNDQRFRTVTREHFYFVGAKLENRNPIEECLITNF